MGAPDFLENDIRVKADLDGLGALGDAGWYCIRGILWANSYQLPSTAVAFPTAVKNDAGVVLSCGASLHWEDGRLATLHCSFLAHLTMNLTVVGTRGTLQLSDHIIPFQQDSAQFTFASGSAFNETVTGWISPPEKHVIYTALPQEALMVSEFARLVSARKKEAAPHGDGGKAAAGSAAKPAGDEENKWPVITRKTQAVLDAVKASVDNGYKPVRIVF